MPITSFGFGMPSRYLFFNGAVVLFAGLLSGVQFWLSIILEKGRDNVRAWRVAHATLVIDGLLMLVFGLILPHIPLGETAGRVMAWALISSGYGFSFALAVGAWAKIRGLTPRPWGINTAFFAGHFIGASGAFVGISIFIYGTFSAL
jgi:uncharacterized membrane protein